MIDISVTVCSVVSAIHVKLTFRGNPSHSTLKITINEIYVKSSSKVVRYIETSNANLFACFAGTTLDNTHFKRKFRGNYRVTCRVFSLNSCRKL